MSQRESSSKMSPTTIQTETTGLSELRALALQALLQSDVDRKCELVVSIADDLQVNPVVLYVPGATLPGRPDLPVLVSPREVPSRGVHTLEGRVILLHAIAHIEFNAINLALDIIWRFDGLPEQFYRDWLQVAKEEVKHFLLLRTYLRDLGFEYGDFAAHNGLWEMAIKTQSDLLARLALVPRVLEARGLDVSPAIRERLIQAGDTRGAQILDVILEDEIGHVRFGNDWYDWVCRQQGLDPVETDRRLEIQYQAPKQRGPFNLEARRAAGFTQTDLARLLEQ